MVKSPQPSASSAPPPEMPAALAEQRNVPDAFEPDTMYDVQLWRMCEWRRRRFAPGQAHQMLGSVCADEDVLPAILTATPVRDPNAE